MNQHAWLIRYDWSHCIQTYTWIRFVLRCWCCVMSQDLFACSLGTRQIAWHEHSLVRIYLFSMMSPFRHNITIAAIRYSQGQSNTNSHIHTHTQHIYYIEYTYTINTVLTCVYFILKYSFSTTPPSHIFPLLHNLFGAARYFTHSKPQSQSTPALHIPALLQ